VKTTFQAEGPLVVKVSPVSDSPKLQPSIYAKSMKPSAKAPAAKSAGIGVVASATIVIPSTSFFLLWKSIVPLKVSVVDGACGRTYVWGVVVESLVESLVEAGASRLTEKSPAMAVPVRDL